MDCWRNDRIPRIGRPYMRHHVLVMTIPYAVTMLIRMCRHFPAIQVAQGLRPRLNDHAARNFPVTAITQLVTSHTAEVHWSAKRYCCCIVNGVVDLKRWTVDHWNITNGLPGQLLRSFCSPIAEPWRKQSRSTWSTEHQRDIFIMNSYRCSCSRVETKTCSPRSGKPPWSSCHSAGTQSHSWHWVMSHTLLQLSSERRWKHQVTNSWSTENHRQSKT